MPELVAAELYGSLSNCLGKGRLRCGFEGKEKTMYPWFLGGKLIRFLWPVMLELWCKILEIGPESWFVNNPIPDPSRQSDLRYELITAALDLVLKTANTEENCINITINGMILFIYSFAFIISIYITFYLLSGYFTFWILKGTFPSVSFCKI